MCHDPGVTWAPFIAAAAGALVAAGFGFGNDPSNLHNGLIAVSSIVMGASILRFHRGHRAGELLLAVGAAHAVMFFGRQYGQHPTAPLAEWVTWFGVWPLPATLVLVAVTVMCFPAGRLPGPRWTRAIVVMAVAGGALTLMSALWSPEYERMGLLVQPPFVLPGRASAIAVFDVARPVAYTAFQVVWVSCVVWQIVRARGTEARQLRFFVFAVVLNLAVLVGGLIATGSPRAGLLTVPLLPVAAGVSIIASSYEALLAEQRASGKRMVVAEDQARRRLERDLHDGVQHGLLVLGIELGRLVALAEAKGDDELAQQARSSRDQLLAAVTELRELARGIHPAALTQDGLEAALGFLADRSPIPVRLDVDVVGRCGSDTEATAYFVASEGIANAARYSGATHVTVRVARDDETLALEVIDDGAGGAHPLRGLVGLTDRVVAAGGRFQIDSPVGRGTRLHAVIPCE
jgi:signal transduction histidine kinase